MGKSARVKGHSFENKMKHAVNEYLEKYNLPYSVSRNLNQTRDGGADLIGLDNFQIECKRYKKNNSDLPQNAWWKQVLDSCKENNDIPILIWKYDYQDVQVQFPVVMFNFTSDFDESFSDYPARMKFDDFMFLFMCYLEVINYD